MNTVNRLVPWVIGAFVLSVALTAIYLVMQQVERLGADDAGTRLATTVAASSEDPAAAPGDRIDAARSDAEFYVVFDKSGHPLGGNGYLNGELASPPAGVLTTAFERGTNHVTWETPDGRRFATVELRSAEQVIMAAQSLAPTEARIDQIAMLLLLGWAASVVLLAIGAIIHVRIAKDFD